MIGHSNLYMALKNGRFRTIFDEFRLRLWSTAKWYGFERDLSIPLVSRAPRIPFHVRELREDDVPVLLNLTDAKDEKGFKDRLIRLSMVRANIPTCYVAVTSDGIPCNMQWMFGSDVNDRLQRFSRGGLPVVNENEVLIENAFTPEPFRRQGLDLEVLRYMFNLARKNGKQRAILFVRDQNQPSQKLVSKIGFTPFCLKTCSWRLFLRRFKFTHIQQEDTVFRKERK
jgi:hypothetical protein